MWSSVPSAAPPRLLYHTSVQRGLEGLCVAIVILGVVCCSSTTVYPTCLVLCWHGSCIALWALRRLGVFPRAPLSRALAHAQKSVWLQQWWPPCAPRCPCAAGRPNHLLWGGPHGAGQMLAWSRTLPQCPAGLRSTLCTATCIQGPVCVCACVCVRSPPQGMAAPTAADDMDGWCMRVSHIEHSPRCGVVAAPLATPPRLPLYVCGCMAAVVALGASAPGTCFASRASSLVRCACTAPYAALQQHTVHSQIGCCCAVHYTAGWWLGSLGWCMCVLAHCPACDSFSCAADGLVGDAFLCKRWLQHGDMLYELLLAGGIAGAYASRSAQQHGYDAPRHSTVSAAELHTCCMEHRQQALHWHNPKLHFMHTSTELVLFGLHAHRLFAQPALTAALNRAAVCRQYCLCCSLTAGSCQHSQPHLLDRPPLLSSARFPATSCLILCAALQTWRS